MNAYRATAVLAAGLITLSSVGCTSIRIGKKCTTCEANAVYPAPSYYDNSSSLGTGQSLSPIPAPIPPAEPMPLPGNDVNVPPPPPAEAVRARPLQNISASTRGAYESMSNGVRGLFTR